MAVTIAGNTAQFLAAMDQANKKVNSFEAAIKRASKTLSAAFIANKVYDDLEYGVGVMKDFERQMDTVAAISGAAGDDLKKLQDNAVNLAGAFRSIDIAKMETELARLGFQTSEIINSTKAIVDLATATGEDLAKSAEIVGSTLRIFHKDAKESGAVAESMAIGFNTSALALDNFGEAMKYVGPVANAANLSLEQTTALLGVLADNGIKGSMAGTSLRKIISDLGQGAAPVLNQRLREMAAAGLSGADAMDEVGRTAYASLLILAKNTDAIDNAVKVQSDMKGTLEATSKIMQDNLQGDIDKLNASWDRMFISTSKLTPVFRTLTQSATILVDALSGVRDADRVFEAAMKATQKGFTGRGNSIPERYVDHLKKLAVEAGREIGFTWDETGKEVLSVFEIVKSGSALGPQQGEQDFVPPFLKALKFETPKVVRSIIFLEGEISKLNDKIKQSGDLTQIQGYQREIIKLQNEIDKLTGKMEVNPIFSPAETQLPFDPERIDLNKEMPFPFFDNSEEQKELEDSMKWFDEWKQNRIDGYNEAARASSAFGDIIGDTLASSMQDGEKFGRVLARQVDRAINELYRLAIGYVLAKAAKDSLYNPLGAIIGLTAGLVAFKAIYAASTKPQSTAASGGNELTVSIGLQDDAGKIFNAKVAKQNRRDARTKAA